MPGPPGEKNGENFMRPVLRQGRGRKKKGEGTSLPGCSFPPFMTLPEQRDRYW